MYLTWGFARFQSSHRISPCRSSQNRGISLFFSSFFRVFALARSFLGQYGAYSEVAAARLFRCSLRVRVEKKLAHLAGHIAGDGSLLRPCKCLIPIGRFQNPETPHVLLGLGLRAAG